MMRLVLTISSVLCLAACGGGPPQDSDTLPGRSRPLLQHDWSHPRDFKFAPVAFTPPDPAGSLVTTASGLRAFVLESPSDATVRIAAAIPLGRLYEQAGEAGAATLLVRALAGDGSRSAAAHARSLRLESLGARLIVAESLDLTVVSLEVLPDMWRDAVGFIVETVRNPLLNDAAIGEFRAGPGYSAITSNTGGEDFRPKIELERLLVGDQLAPPEAGTRVAAAAVRALAARTLRPDTVVLGIGGRVSRGQVQGVLDQGTRDWRASGDPRRLASLAAAPSPVSRFHAIDVEETNEWVPRQGWIAIGRVINLVPDVEQPALAVMAEVLDNRLNIATREMRGLSNRTTFVMPDTATRAGLLHIRSGGRQESVAPLVKLSFDEIRRLHRDGEPITDREMRRAKGTLVLGQWQRSLDGAGQVSTAFAMETVRRGSTDYLLGWPSAIESVTVEQVKHMAKSYLDPAAMSTVIVGPIANIRRARHPRWPATLDELGFEWPSDATHGTR